MSDILKELTNIIRERKNSDINKSYTSQLISSGIDKCILKMEEEFFELKEAMKKKDNVVHESADLIYHFFVCLEVSGINFEDVIKELEKRKNQSGIEEKKNR